jgi:cell shape-determining protein MreC
MDNAHVTFPAIFGRALRAGYTGSNAIEAIVAAAVASEQHASSERLREEIEELRTVMHRQQKEKIEQQSRAIQELREKNTQLEQLSLECESDSH